MKTKVSAGQFFCIGIILHLFIMMSSQQPFHSESIVGAVLSAIFQVMLFMPIIAAKKSNPYFTFPKIFSFLIGIFLIINGAWALRSFETASHSIRFPVGSRFVAIGLLALAAIYACHVGLKAISRAGVFIFALSILVLLLLLFGAVSRIELLNFTPVRKNILEFAINDFAMSSEITVLLALLIFTDKDNYVFSFIWLKTLITVIISFIGVTVLGRLTPLVGYPFFAIGAYSQPIGFQRTDALYIMLFTFLCVMFLSIHLFLAASMISALFPKYRYSKFTAVLLMLCALFIEIPAQYRAVGALVLMLSAPVCMLPKVRRVLSNEKA